MSDKDPLHVLDVVLRMADTPHPSGVMFSKEVLEKAILLRQLNPSKLRGELNPRTMRRDTGDKTSIAHIAENNVSHEISNLRMEGDQLIGDVKILPTPAGKRLEKLFDNGRMAIRGAASYNANREVVGLQIVSIDVVAKD